MAAAFAAVDAVGLDRSLPAGIAAFVTSICGGSDFPSAVVKGANVAVGCSAGRFGLSLEGTGTGAAVGLVELEAVKPGPFAMNSALLGCLTGADNPTTGRAVGLNGFLSTGPLMVRGFAAGAALRGSEEAGSGLGTGGTFAP